MQLLNVVTKIIDQSQTNWAHLDAKIVKSYDCHLVPLLTCQSCQSQWVPFALTHFQWCLQFLLWDWQWLTQRNVKYQVWTLLSSLNRNFMGFSKRCVSYCPSLQNKEKSRIWTTISKYRKQYFILQTKPDIKSLFG